MNKEIVKDHFESNKITVEIKVKNAAIDYEKNKGIVVYDIMGKEQESVFELNTEDTSIKTLEDLGYRIVITHLPYLRYAKRIVEVINNQRFEYDKVVDFKIGTEEIFIYPINEKGIMLLPVTELTIDEIEAINLEAQKLKNTIGIWQ